MKRKFLVGLLCLTVLLVPTFAKAAAITASDISAENQAKLKSTAEDSFVNIKVGNVSMLKSVSGEFIILTFSETGGFTADTYNSMLTALRIILSTKNYNHFVNNYSSISPESEVKFTGFRVKKNPSRLNAEASYFKDADILRIEICSNEFKDIPDATPTPSSTPKTSTPVKNPSTGDMNMLVVASLVLVAGAGAYFSVRKIRENA